MNRRKFAADLDALEAVARAEAERRGYPCPDGEADNQDGWLFVEGAIWLFRKQQAALQAVEAQIQYQLSLEEDLNSSTTLEARYAAAYSIQLAMKRTLDTNGDTP